MKENFDAALKAILHHEGGFVNHPKDPGGMTNLGVTKRVWEEWVGDRGARFVVHGHTAKPRLLVPQHRCERSTPFAGARSIQFVEVDTADSVGHEQR